ncbi:MAG: ATP-grasp domain-containing protein [Actinobacteria bacterium]|nr:ATP-grasp domain-containing protein [Actinomycetota bacterium]MDQ3532671.1 ATP-grasp domain-containing protein [Actinomycetota bacterium]
MDLLRPLGLANIPCAAVAPPGAPPRYSRFTRAVVEWADPSDESGALVDKLIHFARGQSKKPVLFYEGDWDLLLISRHRGRLASYFHFVVPDGALVEDLVDKARFRTLARTLGLPVPPSTQVHTASADPDDVDLAYPLILKPLTRRTATWMPIFTELNQSEAKALEVRSREELTELWPRLASSGVELLAQELIEGPETNIESYHAYVDRDGSIVASFTGRKIRTYPKGYGHSTALEITASAEVASLGADLIQRLDLRGVAKLDFKRSPEGTLYLLEVNPRFSLWHHPGAEAGVNLPALVYDDMVARTRRSTGPAEPGVRWCRLLNDVKAARGEGISFVRWLPWALTCDARATLAWDDPLPFLRGVLWARAAAALRRLRRRTARP